MRTPITLLTICLIIVLLAISGQSVGASGDFWIMRPPMPNGGFNFGTASLDGEVYVIGHNFTYVFDPNANTWVSKTSMPSNRQGFAIATSQNKIYVIGGWNSIDPNTGIAITLGTNEMYDPATDTWTSKTSMPTPATSMEANVVGNKIYVISGLSNIATATISSSNWVYDPLNDSWGTAASIPTSVISYASAVVDNKIYVVGGDLGGKGISNLNQIFDPATNSWSVGQPLLTAVRHAGAGATTGQLAPARLYVIGGSNNGFDGIKTTQIYDPQTDQWIFGAQMSIARLGLAVATLNDTLYALGGESYTGNIQVRGEIYATNEQYLPLDYQGAIPTPYVPTPSPQSTNTPKPTISPTPPNFGPTSSPTPSLPSQLPTINTGQEPQETEPPLTALATVSIAIICIGLLVYFKKRRGNKRPE